MKKAIICGYYGQGNAGDEALLVSILEKLPSEFKPVVLSGNPEATSKSYGVESYSRLGIIRQIIQLGKSDLFIWGGGSLIQDVTSIRSPLFYLGLMKLAQLKGLTTIAYAQGIGPINSPFIRKLTKQILSKCNGISVRDQASAKILDLWGLKYIIAPDPVWALSSKINPNLQLLPTPRIAVNLRSHPLLSQEKIAVLTQALINLQARTKVNIILVPFQASKDLAICEKMKKKLGEKAQIVALTNPQELKGLFAEVKMLIGMRLHSLIMAGAEKCTCFAISYDPKVSNLTEEIGIDGYELENLPDNVSKITECWLKIFEKSVNLSDNKRAYLAQQANQHQNLFILAINA